MQNEWSKQFLLLGLFEKIAFVDKNRNLKNENWRINQNHSSFFADFWLAILLKSCEISNNSKDKSVKMSNSHPATSSFVKDAIPGIVLGILTRYTEIRLCLQSSCDSHILIVEKILIHSAFVLGYASPSRMVWEILKGLIMDASTQISHFLDHHPNLESTIRIGLSLLEQAGLAKIWDHVRDGSICMTFNNCDGDFLSQLNNIKIKYCRVQYPFDMRKKPSVCERVFNDSPLILLAIVMLILALLASVKFQPGSPKPPALTVSPVSDSTGAVPSENPTSPNFDQHGSRNSNAFNPPAHHGYSLMSSNSTDATSTNPTSPAEPPPVPTDSTPKSPTIPSDSAPPPTDSPSTNPSSPTEPASVPTNPEPSSPAETPPAPAAPGGDQPPQAPSTSNPQPMPPENATQVIHARCPNCTKAFSWTVPKPWRLCCRDSFPMLNGTRESQSKKDKFSEKAVKKVFKDIKCKYCLDKLKKGLQELAKRKCKTTKPKK